MPKPWLSVISPIYNGEKYLSYALDSIIIQEDRDIECIVVNGESTDGTLSILHAYQDRLPLKILQRERKDNWVTKTNYALSLARGEYICFLHHDDFWLKDRLKTMRRLTEQFPDVVLFIHPSNFIDYRGNNLGLWSCPLPAYPKNITPKLLLERLLIQNFISILGPVFKREAALKVGGLDESLWYTADWDFWLKIAACGNSLYYPKALSGFRIHTSSQTMVRSSHQRDFQEQLESVANKHLALWKAPVHLKQSVRKIAVFSIEINVSLAGIIHGTKPHLFEIIISFLSLGPLGWHRYLRDSRIWERVSARLKTRLSS